jgi:hypothetical protein
MGLFSAFVFLFEELSGVSCGGVLYQNDSCFFAFLPHRVRPNAGLRLTNVGLLKQDHAETALTNASTNA